MWDFIAYIIVGAVLMPVLALVYIGSYAVWGNISEIKDPKKKKNAVFAFWAILILCGSPLALIVLSNLHDEWAIKTEIEKVGIGVAACVLLCTAYLSHKIDSLKQQNK